MTRIEAKGELRTSELGLGPTGTARVEKDERIVAECEVRPS
jgi:hypothetical protein